MQKDSAQFTLIEGNSPIFLSAPHVYLHKRPTLTGVFKQSEPFTDILCQNISKELSASAIFLTKDVEYDPNFFKLKRNPYKEAVREEIKREKKEIFLDIHGLSDENKYDVGIYYLTRFRKSKQLARELRDALDRGQLKGISIHIFRFPKNGQETLSEFVASKLKIPALQIEVARYIREDEVLRNELVKNLTNFLNSF